MQKFIHYLKIIKENNKVQPIVFLIMLKTIKTYLKQINNKNIKKESINQTIILKTLDKKKKQKINISRIQIIIF